MAERIKVCFLSPKAYPIFVPDCGGVFGGAEVDIYIISKSLACDDLFDVSVVVADYGQSEDESIDDVSLLRSLKPGSYSPVAVVKLWKALKKAAADIYFIETISPGIVLLSLFCILNGKKIAIRTAHTRDCDGSYLKKHKLLSPMLKFAFKKADIVYTQNECDVPSIKKVYGIKAKPIANGHQLRAVEDKSDRNYILWAARSADVKNPLLFIKLAEALPNQKFVMVCPKAFGDKKYDSLVDKASKVENIEFVKGVRYLQMSSFYDKASLFVNTSDSEGFANTFVEAAKAAVPIVSYKVNPDNFLNKYNCGRCAEGDFGKLVDIVKSLLDDDRLNKQLGDNGRKYVEDNHDIAKIIESYKADFKELMQ